MNFYPPSPAAVPDRLTATSARYKGRIVAAVLGVVVFFALYFGLTGWLLLVGFRAARGASTHPLRALLIGGPTVFLVIVLLKGLFARRRMSRDALLEITASDEPDLFAFIQRIAQETGAPLPSKVYLSSDVNASVFFDVGLLNLIFPSRKNLIVGLGLVNALTLDELKAVVAHEFGHFGQRSMGIGQWASVAQGFAADLVMRRDFLDGFIHILSRMDFRIAWIGWVLRMLVWSLRAIIEQLLRFVILLNRALQRQMEFQADLVSVRVAGSDSLVHALHRLHAADGAWGQAADFVIQQARFGRRCPDLFAVQSRFVERYREVHAIDGHGATPARPDRPDGTHRVFADTIADAPRMWSTHPSNQARELNCKSRYVPSHLDERSAWTVFADPDATRCRLTAHFLALTLRDADAKAEPRPEPVEMSPEECLDRVDALFNRPSLDRRFQGLYTTMHLTRALRPAEGHERQLAVEPEDVQTDALVAHFDAVFDESVSAEVEAYFQLGDEFARLEGLRRGLLDAPGGVILHRGEHLTRRELAGTVEVVRAEVEAQRRRLAERFQGARGIARRVARDIDSARGPRETSWEAHHRGLLELLEYAEHTVSDLDDAVAHFDEVLSVVLADGKITKTEMARLEVEGDEITRALRRIFEQRNDVRLCDPVRWRLSDDGASWGGVLGPSLSLSSPTAADFDRDWIGIAASWWSGYLDTLTALAVQTVDAIIEAEDLLLAGLRSGKSLEEVARELPDAPVAASVPSDFRRFYFGDERERQERLGWWDRFQVAEGVAGGLMRFVVATTVLAPALLVGFFTTNTTELHLYNGLERIVEVQIEAQKYRLGPHSSREVEVVQDDTLLVTTRTESGELIETVELEGYEWMRAPVYNVAAASGFVRWWATYGTARERSPEFASGHLVEGNADFVFTEPPTSVSMRGSGTTRGVLQALGAMEMSTLDPSTVRTSAEAHVRWDDIDSDDFDYWLLTLPRETGARAAREIFAREPTPRALWLLTRTLTPREEVEFCAQNDGAPGIATAFCARDESLVSRARSSHDRMERLLAAEAAARMHRFSDALFFSQAGRRAHGYALSWGRIFEARMLRMLGRDDAAVQLPSDDGPYDWFIAVERGAPDAGLLADVVQNRARGQFGAAELALAQTLESADQLAFGAASEHATPAWFDALRETSLPLSTTTGAAVAHALALVHEDPALATRAQAAYARAGGALVLSDPRSATPETWLEGDEERAFSTQAEARLVAWIVWGDHTPVAWRELVRAGLFSVERPAL